MGAFSFAEIDFNREIRPILSENCFRCHGPDPDARKGGSREKGKLRLDTSDGAQMDLGGYAAIVPGKPNESELIYLVSTDIEEDRMPPKKEGKPLSAEQIALLGQWISEGGEYDIHWSYQKPKRPTLPKFASSEFRLHNPIDSFVANRLVSAKLPQAPEADRNTLARRAALDLTGLPPTLAEVEAFVHDPAMNAFDRYLDRLLQKPAYGEHWARMWLDLARYADSAGYADDPSREIWGFRDYVIRSFNENKPFDQFTIEQIAGDLLDNPSVDQRVATAFHRNTKTNSEGGTIDEEFRNEAVVDRVNTTMAVWMGTTIDCAQCHTHKYDPITQEEYFKMFALFNNTADEDRKDEKPVIALFSEIQNEKRAQIEATLSSLKESLKAKRSDPSNFERRYHWERALISGTSWRALKPPPADMKAASGAPFSINTAGVIEIAENSRPQDTYTLKVKIPNGIQRITSIKLEVFPSQNSSTTVSNPDSEWVINEFEIRLVGSEPEEPAEDDSNSDEEDPPPKAEKTPKLKIDRSTASFEQEWYSVDALYDRVSNDRFSGWAVQGNVNSPNEAVLELALPIEPAENQSLEFKLIQNFPEKKTKRFRLSISDRAVPFPAVPASLKTVLEKDPKRRSAAEEDELVAFFSLHDPEAKETHSRIAQLEKELKEIEPITVVPVMRQVATNQLRKTNLQYRGNYLDKGPEVKAGVPAIFHSLSHGAPTNRLALAYWLVDENNPLTARVVVNRYWEALFGIGIVSTSEEFGSQGDLPSHPDLLDWLAVEFKESGWNVKHLLKLIASSATYRQSSKTTPANYERDPANRLLARGPRFRISAEMVRDQALAVSGLLDRKLYGPSVNPPQPEFGLKAAFGSDTDWKTSEGADRYRRGIYTTWRRSNPYPSMAAFDAPNREFCTVRRERTNTPLQALVTLNDPVYIEASQALGRKMSLHKGMLPEKIEYGFESCLIRKPTDQESKILVDLFSDARNRYSLSPGDAYKMATDPIGELPEGSDAVEIAAWTVVGNALLNLDEMFLKR